MHLYVHVCLRVGAHEFYKETTRISVPVKNVKDPRGFSMKELELIEPHNLLKHLFVTTGIVIPERDVREYWHHVRRTAPQSCYLENGASDLHIPVSIFGDAAKMSNSAGKIIAFYLALPLEESLLYKHHTLNRLYKRIAYSLNKAFDGIDERWYFVLTEFKGDWLHHKQVLRFRSSWQRMDNVCYRCTAVGKGANDSTFFYNYWDSEPEWEEYDTTSFLATQIVEPDPCLSPAFGFWI